MATIPRNFPCRRHPVLLVKTPEDESARVVALASFVGVAYLATIAISRFRGPWFLRLLLSSPDSSLLPYAYARGKGQWGVIFGRAHASASQ